MIYIYNSLETLLLPEIEGELRKLTADMTQTGLTLALVTLQPVWSLVRGLTEGPEGMLSLGDVEKGSQTSMNEGTTLWLQYGKMLSAYYYCDYDLALKYSVGIHYLYTKFRYNSVACGFIIFGECMVLLAHARNGPITRLRNVFYVKRRLKLLEHAAYMAPENLLDKQHLLQAELAVIHGNPKKACMNYRSGILHARSQGRRGMESLGNERLAKYLVESGQVNDAILLLDEACRLYEEWGARYKVNSLREYRDSLLLPTGA